MAERLATRDAAPAFYRSSPDRDNAPEHLERRAGPCFRAQLSINSRQLFYDAERFWVFSHSTGASSYVLVCALAVRGGAIALGRTPRLIRACGVADTGHSGGIPFSAAGRLRSNKWTPRCPRCDFKPNTKRALERHLNTEHREDRTFHQSISKPRRARGRAGCVPIRVCPYCAWVCITKGEMVSHVRAHGSLTEDPKPYVDPFFVSSQRPRRAPSQRSAPKRTRTPARPRALAVPGGAAKLVNRGKRALPKLAETALRGGKVYMVDGPVRG